MEITELSGPDLRPAARSSTAAGILDGIPCTVLGTCGADLVFLHANGYPPECYRTLLSALASETRVWAMHQRPLWRGSHPGAVDAWHPLSEDLLRFLEERGLENVFAVGHSMGAIVALRAALWAPARFWGLVLLDPVLTSKRNRFVWRLARSTGMGHGLHAKIASASRRKRHFASREQTFRGYRRHRVFRYMSDEALGTLIAGLTAPDPQGGYTLRYSPEWEARMYHTAIWNDGDLWDGLPQLAIPTLIVRGTNSDTFTDSTSRAVHRANPRIKISVVTGASHLVPLERPEPVGEAIREFLRDHGTEHDSGGT